MTTIRCRSLAASPSAHQPMSQPCLGCKGNILRVDAWGIWLLRTRLYHPAPVAASTPSCSPEALRGSTRRQHRPTHTATGRASSKVKQAQRGMDSYGKASPHGLSSAISKSLGVRDCPDPFPKTKKANKEQGYSYSPLCSEQKVGGTTFELF